MKVLKGIGAVIGILLFVATSETTWAASLKITPTTVATVGGTVLVPIALDTSGETINALEATILIDANIAEIVDSNIGGSFVTVWISRKISNTNSAITLSGIIPGGYKGTGTVLNLVVRGKKVGQTAVRIADAAVLLHDGLGTAAELTSSNGSLAIQVAPPASPTESNQQPALPPTNTKDSIDSIKPEPFDVQLIRDEDVFGGRWYIVFNTIDGQSGVGRYEITEDGLPPIMGESPYVLQDQTLSGPITVRAFDEFGNVRETRTFPPLSQGGSPWYWILTGAAVAILIYELYMIIRLSRNSADVDSSVQK